LQADAARRYNPHVPIPVVHIITRMILGGAQENTLFTCEGLNALRAGGRPVWDVTLVTGPALGPEGELINRARRNGVRTVVVDQMRRAIHPLRDAVVLCKLVRILRRIRPAVVHTHSSKAGILGRLAAFIARVPVIVHTIHGLPYHPYEHPLKNAVYILSERLAALVSDKIVTVADTMTRKSLEAGVGRPTLYRTVYSGMEVDEFLRHAGERARTRREFGFADSDIVVGKVARLFHLKGHEYVLEAAPRILEACPDVRFFFVGDGILRQPLESQAERLGIRERLVFAGLVDPSEIPRMVHAMDIVVHTSLREGLARVLVQGLLCAKPVVSYEIDGAPEVIIDGETGRIVPPESVDELAEAVIELATDRERAGEMGRRGRDRFTAQFRVEKMVTDIHELYLELLDRRGRLPDRLQSPNSQEPHHGQD
jgi:glycosyltransferase involved in cell wall biosynthesis